MKPDNEIQERSRQLLTEAFERRVADAEARLPTSCVYNHRQSLDYRKRGTDGDQNPGFNRITDERHLPVVQTIGLCMYGSEDPATWPGTICEEPVDAERCPPQAFTPKTNRTALQAEFEGQIRDLAWVQANLPEVHALLWVLGPESVPSAPLPEREPAKPVVLTPWAKFWLWVAGLGRKKVYMLEESDAVRGVGENPQA